MIDIQIRDAVKQDAAEVVRLVRVLVDDDDETSEVSEEFVHEYLAYPGCGILLAYEDKDMLGLLSYSMRPNLYHAGNSCLIEELLVDAAARSRGIGGMLVSAIMEKAEAAGCAEISVSSMLDNGGVIRFYRKHGFGDDAVYLERHF